MISQEVVAEECRVVQGDVQAWEAGTRIPTGAELDALARVLDLDRQALAEAETGSAVYRNELSAQEQAELDAAFWGSDVKVPIWPPASASRADPSTNSSPRCAPGWHVGLWHGDDLHRP